MRVAVLGRTEILWNSIKLLETSKHDIVLIGTCKAAPEYAVNEKDFEQEAERLDVPFFNSAKINSEEILSMLSNANADVAISMNWLTVIGQKAIDCFKYGILNAHAGDLPRYRGNACPNWAIISGEKRIGITIHYMLAGEIDAGDILVKDYYPLGDDTTITEIYRYMDDRIPKMYLEALDKIAEGEPPLPQSRETKEILRCYPRVPSDSLIDWEMSCENICRLVRASGSPFAGAYTYFKEYKIRIWECSAEKFQTPVLVVPGQIVMIDKLTDRIGVAAKDGIIIIHKAEVKGSEKKITDVITSVRVRMNYCVQDKLYELERRIEKMENIYKGGG